MGGFALGLDRVCIAACRRRDSNRGWPMIQRLASGSDLMSSAPSPVSNEQLKEVSASDASKRGMANQSKVSIVRYVVF